MAEPRELDRLLSDLGWAKNRLWAHARAEHLMHSPTSGQEPTGLFSCCLEPCKTVREAIEGGLDA